MKNPIIIGAGISGLIAALELEKAGYNPTILEASDSVGGRIKSDNLNGLPADHGFQVLLTEYPEAQHYLDYEKLDLVKFLPGSLIFKKGKTQKIGDPLRNISFLWSTILADVGSVKDKWLTFKLSLALKKKNIDTIFAEKETTTKVYLQEYGFSDKMIRNFFQPFFTGIYLEDDLDTSSRMFEFVYKMFGSGHAAIPRPGMQAIPNQLASQLSKTLIRFNSSVDFIESNTVTLASGETISSEHIIIATDPGPILKKNNKDSLQWKSCYNLYFQTEKFIKKDPIIGLLPEKNTVVNNFHYLDDLFESKTENNKSVLSVTVVNNLQLSEKDLVKKVKSELQQHCNIKTGELVKIFHIKKALPKINDLKYEPSKSSVILAPGIFCCGDYLANSSINAAMASGRVVAELVVEAG